MKKIFSIAATMLFLTSFPCVRPSYGQIAEVGSLIAAGAADAQTLLQPYITPAVNAFGAALSSGWYNTAEPHSLGGFDLTFNFNTGIVPAKYESFDIDNSQLSFLQLEDPSSSTTSTVAGPKEIGPQVMYNFSGFTAPAFAMPRGMNSNYIPAAMVQAGIGLIKGTEVMVRYLPNFNFSDNEIGLWGIGGKHDVKQWIPGLKKMPVLQVSIMYGYTKLHTYVSLDVDPASINAGGLPGATSSDWDNQQLQIVAQSQTANLLFSANLPVVCFYGGAGFVTTKTSLSLKGDFPVVQLDGINPVVAATVDPINMEIKNQDGGITKPRLNAGVRFKLAVITIHVDYSWANYSVLTGGLGVSFR